MCMSHEGKGGDVRMLMCAGVLSKGGGSRIFIYTYTQGFKDISLHIYTRF